MSNEEMAEQLVNIYYKYEHWQADTRMGREDALLYHRTMLERGVIRVLTDGKVVCGYLEVWRLDWSQLGRLLCGQPFCSMQEDVLSGPVAWVANIFVLPDYRHGRVIRQLKKMFLEQHGGCTNFAGDKVKRGARPFQIFTRDKLLQGVANGII